MGRYRYPVPVVLMAVLLILGGCLSGSSGQPPGPGQEGPPPQSPGVGETGPPQGSTPPAGGGERPPGGPGQPPAPVPVVVFSARETKLEPVLRSVAVPEDGCPAAAVQALVAGPTAVEKKSGLGPVLPASTRVLGVKVADGVAVVDLSREVITRASEIGASSTTEALALNALYFTLAQFRGVEKVKLLVEGKNRGAVDGMRIEDFWGHIGLPDCLSGSPSLLDVSPRQEVGEPTDGLRLASVRWSAHPGLFRLVFQLEGPEGETSPIIPATVATYSATARVIGITINGVRGTKVAALAPGQKVQLGDWRAEVVRWDTLEDDRAYAFSLALRPVRAYGWRLWSLADPARIIVDVFACGP